MCHTEAVVRRCSVKKVFLEISQNSQENTCAREISKNTFCEISKNTFFIDHLWWLLLVTEATVLANSKSEVTYFLWEKRVILTDAWKEDRINDLREIVLKMILLFLICFISLFSKR